jgi:hypothetical protein
VYDDRMGYASVAIRSSVGEMGESIPKWPPANFTLKLMRRLLQGPAA